MSTTTRHSRRTSVVCFFAVAALAFASAGHASDAKRKNPASKLYIADVQGIASINTGDKIEDLTTKSVYAAEGAVLETAADSNNTIVLSNGTGLALDPNTRIEMKRFLQEPFSPNRTDLEVEPSVSQTEALLSRGSVGLCNSKLVAGSTMTYHTRHASIVIRGRKVVIETSDLETIVTVMDGEVTIRGELMAGGQTVQPGQQAVITRSSHFEPPVIIIRPIPKADENRLGDKVALACMARQTVYFEVAERQNQNDPDGVFTQADAAGHQVIMPVQVLPGTIPPNTAVSAHKITTP